MKRRVRKRRPPNFRVVPFLLLLLIGMLCISPLPPCFATQADPSHQAATLETITVTADKRQEDVQQITTSVTVLSDVQIEDAHIESTRDFFARAEMQGVGSYYLSRENSMEQGSYILYNAKIGYERETWDVYLTVQNITDEQYFLQGADMGDIGWVGSVGPARSVALSFNYRF